MRVGVVDIGTNSMRLLVRDEDRDLGRWVEVTSLGKGVDATGRLSAGAIERTIAVFDRFGRTMDELGVDRRRAVATSATRDATNRDVFLDRAERSLGVRPDVIGGDAEGRLAYAGATSDLDPGVDYMISD
ncbi:MAG: exopolyphosphatase, partial [Acidimicrobiia bacterium]